MGVLEVFYSALIPYQAMATGIHLMLLIPPPSATLTILRNVLVSICNNKETLWKQSANTLII